MKIRPDTWQSFYGGAVEPGEERPQRKYTIELDVETEAFRFGGCSVPPFQVKENVVAFVDGVRRVDLHAIVEGIPPRFGLFGSVATGALVMEGGKVRDLSLALREVRVGRFFVTNVPDPVERVLSARPAGNALGPLSYSVRMSSGADPASFNNVLMNEMGGSEAEISALLSRDPGLHLVCSDGPIPFERSPTSDPGKLAGIIKSVHEFYLPSPQLGVVAALHLGERTHIFSIRYEDARTSKFSCFVRIQATGPYGSSFSNLVRLEIPLIPRTEAVRLADRAAAVAIRFASGLYADARAPQNLYPVAALESALKNRLGDSRLVRNRLLTMLGGIA
jgi:hypothetical protein